MHSSSLTAYYGYARVDMTYGVLVPKCSNTEVSCWGKKRGLSSKTAKIPGLELNFI